MRGNGWVAVRSANKDPDFRNRTKVADLEFGRLVRNVLKVLLTRALSGTIIYSTDAGRVPSSTSRRVSERLRPTPEAERQPVPVSEVDDTVVLKMTV